ncbi:unnamed protein product [Thelazia callipaeda]|uniref:Protein sleepless n=1 Tax=Thelazia callipaeda TaxID=103827 RepID=A0A0N5CU85_THECL|nr:unnamed protein product [Thelazia callipaeda]
MHCTGRTTSSSQCSMTRVLTEHESNIVNVSCPPNNEKIYTCKLDFSKEISCALMPEREKSCQYYKDSEGKVLHQFCCCFGTKCLEPPDRLEYQQLPFQELKIDINAAIQFIMTFLVNVLTAKLFQGDLTELLTSIYYMHSGIVSSFKVQHFQRNSFKNMQEKITAWKIRPVVDVKMISYLMSSKRVTNLNTNYLAKNRKYLQKEAVKKHYARSEKILREEWYNTITLMKLRDSHWRTRERLQTGKQLRRTLKEVFELKRS